MSKSSVTEKVSAIYPKILRLAHKYDKQEPEDLAQSVTLTLLSHPERVPDRKEIPTAWVQRVVRNASLDAYRRRKRLVAFDTTDTGETEQIDNDAPPQLQPITPSPEREIDMRLDLVAAMSELSESQRNTMLRRADGASYEEIAAAEHTKVGTVRTRVHYASKSIFGKLRGSAAEHYYTKDVSPEQVRVVIYDSRTQLWRRRFDNCIRAIKRFVATASLIIIGFAVVWVLLGH